MKCVAIHEGPHKCSTPHTHMATLIRDATFITNTAVTIGALLEDPDKNRKALQHVYESLICYVVRNAMAQNIPIHKILLNIAGQSLTKELE